MTVSVLDGVAGPRARPQAAAAARGRVGQEAAGADRGGVPRADLAARRGRRRPCTPGCTGSTTPERVSHDPPGGATMDRTMNSRAARRSTSRSSRACPGAGRSEAAHVLEDLGFFVIDNLPPMLIGKVAELARGHETPVALRARRRRAFRRLPARPLGRDRRAAPPRRHDPHPLSRCRRRGARPPLRGEPPAAPDVRLRPRLRRHRARARRCSSRSSPRPTCASTRRRSTCTSCATACASCSRQQGADSTLQINVVTFGYKHGLPLDVDLVFDCRFLPNPHWVEELRPQTGLDAPVRDYVLAQHGTREFLDELDRLFGLLAAGLRARGQVVPLDRARLHRRPAPQCRDRRAARAAVPSPRSSHRGSPPGRRPCPLTDRERRRRSAGGTGLRSRSRRSGATRATITAVVSVADDGGSSGRLAPRPRRRRPRRPAQVSRRARERRRSVADGVRASVRVGRARRATRSATSMLVGLAESLGDLDRRARRDRAGCSARSGGSIPATIDPVSVMADIGGRRRSIGQVAVESDAPGSRPCGGSSSCRPTRRRRPAPWPRSRAPTRSSSPRARSIRACSRCSAFPRSGPRSAPRAAGSSTCATCKPTARPPGSTAPTTCGALLDHGGRVDTLLHDPSAGLPSARLRFGSSGSLPRPAIVAAPSGLGHDPAKLAAALAALL